MNRAERSRRQQLFKLLGSRADFANNYRPPLQLNSPLYRTRPSHRTVPYERNCGTTKKEVFVRFKNKMGERKKISSDQISRSWKKNNWNGIASIFVSKKKNLFFHSDDFFYFRWNFRPWSTWTTASRWPRPTPSAATSTAWPSSPRTGSISSKELAEKRLGN